MQRPVTWVLLIDAGEARVLRKPDPAPEMANLPLETVLDRTSDVRPLREIMSDKPGRSFSSHGHGQSAMEYSSDPVRDETRAFARDILTELDARLKTGDFARLLVYAPPRMLGLLREVMPDGLAGAVAGEHAKDLLKLPELDLRSLLQQVD